MTKYVKVSITTQYNIIRVVKPYRDSRSVHSMRLSHILGQNPNFCLPTCIRRPRWVGGFRQNIAVIFGTEKLVWCGYPKVKEIWRYVYSFWQNACTKVTDTRAERRTDTAWRLRTRLCSRDRSLSHTFSHTFFVLVLRIITSRRLSRHWWRQRTCAGTQHY